jgi:asparagine synthetase B (glutamine-hydrolysing)
MVGREGQRFTEADIAAMLADVTGHGARTIVHQSPIAKGTVVMALRTNAAGDGFAEARNPAGEPLVVVMGDIRLDHRADLAGQIGVSVNKTDAELVLTAYRRWGRKCLDKLSGEFAFALVDVQKGTVVLARDHTGSRPLVYHRLPRRLVFSSSALSMTKCEGIDHSLDKRRVAEILGDRDTSDRTIVGSVHSLPSGGVLWNDTDGSKIWRWWQTEDLKVKDRGSIEVHANRLEETMSTSVNSSLRASTSVGAFVGPDLASMAVLLDASKQLDPQIVPAYCVSTQEGAGPSTIDLLGAFAERHPGVEPRPVSLSPDALLSGYERLWSLGAGPDPDPVGSLPIRQVVARAASDGVRTLLVAQFGEEGFAADGPRWLIELLLDTRPITMLREVNAWTKVTRHSRITTLTRGVFAPPRPHKKVTFTETAASADIRRALATATGVDIRDPSRTRKLIEHAHTTPQWWLRHGGQDRALARRVLRHSLPGSIVDRSQMPSGDTAWFDLLTEARPELEREIESMADHRWSSDNLDIPGLKRMLSRWPKSPDKLSDDDIDDHRRVLPASIVLSRYARWFEGRLWSPPTPR